MSEALAAQWAALVPGDTTVGPDLLARWAEPHRRYHTLDHLAAVLSVVDANAELAADADAVRLAAWFHDAVYDPRAADNEERSAVLAEAALPDLGVALKRRREVPRLVRLTKDHEARTGDANGGLLADADLAILAAEPDAYAAYARAVREEYAHVPDDAFRAGRTNVLQRLLDLPALFHVVPERHSWTARAHTNMSGEIDALLGR